MSFQASLPVVAKLGSFSCRLEYPFLYVQVGWLCLHTLWCGILDAMRYITRRGTPQQQQCHRNLPSWWWVLMSPPLNHLTSWSLGKVSGCLVPLVAPVLYAYRNITAKKHWEWYQNASTASMQTALMNGYGWTVPVQFAGNHHPLLMLHHQTFHIKTFPAVLLVGSPATSTYTPAHTLLLVCTYWFFNTVSYLHRRS
jgi:hypothetical protein